MAYYNGRKILSVVSPAPKLIEKTITENGTYSASDDGADGFSQITVNVEGGGGGPVYLHNFNLVYSDMKVPVSLFSTRATPYSNAELARMFNGNYMKVNVHNKYSSSTTSFTDWVFANDNRSMKARFGNLGQSSWISYGCTVDTYVVVEMAE